MLKVFIVDDDAATRTNLKTLMNWENYGFMISGEAINGSSAVQMIVQDTPDIVITDMNMPVMDGVALIEFLERHHPYIKVIALSGYDDFNYVRNSMKSGAVDYLLKHMLNIDTLLNGLNNAKNLILYERNKNDRMNRLEEQLIENKAALRQIFIKQLIKGIINNKSEIEQKIGELDLELDTRNLAVVIAEIDDFNFLQERFDIREINKLISSVIDISTEILKDMGKAVFSHLETSRFIIIFSFGSIRSDLYIFNHIFTTIERIKTSIMRYLNITACFSISRLFNDLSEISKIYKEVDLALQDKFFRGKGRIINEPSKANVKNDYFNLDIDDEKNIFTALLSVNRIIVHECVNAIFKRIVDRGANYKSVQMICIELVNIVNRVARELGIEVKTVYSDEEIPYEKIRKFETITEVKEWILSVYGKLINLIEIRGLNTSYSESTKKAIEFVQRNYTRNISLSDAADYIGVNSSYLSRVFKEECGKGFVEYLNMIRVEHAKRLIEKGSIKFKEIVKEVGFNNYTYFFKVFKNIINMTPVEYKEICRNKQKL